MKQIKNIPKRDVAIEKFQHDSKNPSVSLQPYYQQKLPLLGVTKNGDYTNGLSSNDKLAILGVGLLMLAVASAGCGEQPSKEFTDENNIYAKVGTINETATHGEMNIYIECHANMICYDNNGQGVCSGLKNDVDKVIAKDFCHNGEPKEYLRNLSKSF